MNPPPIEIRSALASDHEALTDLAQRAKAAWGYPKEWLELWRDDLRFTAESIQRQQIWVVTMAARPVAVIALDRDESGWEIKHLWVDPSHWGQGLGRRLLTLASQYLGQSRVTVVSDPNAAAFYRRHGFEQVGWVDSRPAGRRLPVLVAQWPMSKACAAASAPRA